jgi:hypothetical protein
MGKFLDTITHGQGYSWFTQGEDYVLEVAAVGYCPGTALEFHTERFNRYRT